LRTFRVVLHGIYLDVRTTARDCRQAFGWVTIPTSVFGRSSGRVPWTRYNSCYRPSSQWDILWDLLQDTTCLFAFAAPLTTTFPTAITTRIYCIHLRAAHRPTPLWVGGTTRYPHPCRARSSHAPTTRGRTTAHTAACRALLFSLPGKTTTAANSTAPRLREHASPAPHLLLRACGETRLLWRGGGGQLGGMDVTAVTWTGAYDGGHGEFG